MAKSIFREKGVQPTDGMLSQVLNEKYPLWNGMVQHITKMDGVVATWKYYGVAWGWSLVYTYKKKTLVYLTPAQSQFYVVLSFNERARERCQYYELPKHIMKCIDAAKSNGAGRTFDVEVIDDSTIVLIKRLLEIKIDTL